MINWIKKLIKQHRCDCYGHADFTPTPYIDGYYGIAYREGYICNNCGKRHRAYISPTLGNSVKVNPVLKKYKAKKAQRLAKKVFEMMRNSI